MMQGFGSPGLLTGLLLMPIGCLAAECGGYVPVNIGMDMPRWEVNYYFVDERGREFKCEDPEPRSKVYSCENQRVYVDSEWRLYTFQEIIGAYSQREWSLGRSVDRVYYELPPKTGAAITSSSNPFEFKSIAIRNIEAGNILAPNSRSYKLSGSFQRNTYATPDCHYEVSRSVFEFGIPSQAAFVIESRYPMRLQKPIDMPDGVYVLHTGKELAHFPILEIKNGLVYRSTEDPHQEGDYKPLNDYQVALEAPSYSVVFTYDSRLSEKR